MVLRHFIQLFQNQEVILQEGEQVVLFSKTYFLWFPEMWAVCFCEIAQLAHCVK